MTLEEILVKAVKEVIHSEYGVDLESVELQATRKDFEGDITVVIFPMLRQIKGNPVAIGTMLGAALEEKLPQISGHNVIKGFLNLSLSDTYYLDAFHTIRQASAYGYQPKGSKGAMMVEFSSPNTNKPLHLGHIRNILLGDSVSNILEAAGHTIYRTQIVNDRGIHICKSMLAWQRFGAGETPGSSGLKGDQLVGKYYVAFDKAYKQQIQERLAAGMEEEEAKNEAPLLKEAQAMLRQWEAGDPEVVALWKKMNGWVYQGFDETYHKLGVGFDKLYYESDTYLLGKDVVADGLSKGVFYRKDDGSVWIDLTDEGLDEKIVLRSDGTAVYMTQDIGTAIQRVRDYPDVNGMVYTVGNEQDYHFKVLFLILKKLGFHWAENLFHLSYGMVDLPSGKMKSREGTVVDADDLVQEMTDTARSIASELGKLEDYSTEQREALYADIGLGALKYYILKVDPKKRILFNPEESVDFQGNTGPFIQYTHARIQSILRSAGATYGREINAADMPALHPKERQLLRDLLQFPGIVIQAAEQYSPALVANYLYELVKDYNSLYQQVSILGEEHQEHRNFRIQLCEEVGKVIARANRLLGMAAPERM